MLQPNGCNIYSAVLGIYVVFFREEGGKRIFDGSQRVLSVREAPVPGGKRGPAHRCHYNVLASMTELLLYVLGKNILAIGWKREALLG